MSKNKHITTRVNITTNRNKCMSKHTPPLSKWSNLSYFRLLVGLFLLVLIGFGCNSMISSNGTSANLTNNVSLASTPTQTSVGVIQGQFSVNSSGAATYEIPIKVPPGTAGMQPHLSLNYDSQGLNGIIGMGWSLEGLSVIERTGANYNLDGFKGGINYDENDRFLLDGERLINMDGNTTTGHAYYTNGATYHTEKENWVKVQAVGSVIYNGIANPESFVLQHKNGLTYTYEKSVVAGKKDSPLFIETGILKWTLSKVEDLNGNSMTINYLIAGDEALPQLISYTANEGQGLLPQRFVSFAYESRNDNINKVKGGAWFRMSKRLKKISTFVGDTTISNLVTQYQLDYVYGEGTARSTLHEIRECGNSEGTIECLTPTVFDCTGTQSLSSTQTTGFLNSYGSMQLQNSNDEDWIWSGDFNADGMQDLMFVDDSYNWHLLPGTPTGFGERLNVKNISSGVFYDHDVNWIWTGDMDGDGGTDLIYKGKSNNEWFYLTFKNGTVQVIYCGIPNNQPNDGNRVWVSDLNGDGISDLSWIPKGSSTDKLYYSLTPAGGHPLNSHKSIELKYDLYSKNGEWVWPGDYNGDGNQDLLFRACGSKPNCYEWFVSFGSKDGLTGPDSISGGFDFYQIPFDNTTGIAAWTGDFNGDGATDFFYLQPSGFYMCMYYDNNEGFSTGWTGTKFPSAEDHVNYTWTGDFNGDGFTDLIYQEGSGQHTPQVALTINTSYSGYPLWNNQKIAWQANNIYTNHSQVQAWCMDVNGDGMSDFVVRDKTNTSTVYANLGTLEFPDVINKITDGLGGVINVDYEPMTNKEIYSADTAVGTNLESQGLYVNSDAYPYPETPQNNTMLLVQSYSRNDGIGNTYSYSYTYQHAMMNMLGWGSLGFEMFTKTDHQTQRITQTIYNQDYPYNGKPDLIVVTANSNVQDSLASAGDTLFQHHFEYTLTNQNGDVIGSTSDQDSAPALYSAGVPSTYQVALSNKWTDYYTYNNYEYSLGERHFYDQYLNEIQMWNLGTTNRSGDDISPSDNVILYKNYSYDVAKWRLGSKKNQGTSGQDQNGFALTNLACGTTPSGIDKYYNVSAYTYDTFMNLKTSCKYNDVSGEWLSTQYEVDGYGNKKKVTGPAGNVTTITYDNQYHTFHDKMTSPPNDNSLQLTQYFGYSPKFGTKLAHMDANGNIFIKSVDIHGRILSKQGPVPNISGVLSSPNSLAQASITGSKSSEFKNAAMVTLEEYTWGKNATIFHKTDKLQSWTNAGESPKNRFYYTYLDGMGRPWLSVKQGPKNQNIATYTQFNSDHQRVQRSLPFLIDDLIVSSPTEVPFWRTKQYDIYKRVVQTTSPDGDDGTELTTNNINYPTLQQKIIEYATNSNESYMQEFNYDFYNSKKKCTTMIIPEDRNATTTISYDFWGRKGSVTDPIGTLIGYYYDRSGRLIKREDPEQGDKSLHYGKNGKLDWMASVGSDTLRYSYDKLGRMTEELHYIGNSLSSQYSTANNSNTYTYDNPADSLNGLGRLDSATVYDPQNTHKRVISWYGYDAYGRSNYTNQMVNSGNKLIGENTFDPLGRRREYVYPALGTRDTLKLTYNSNGIYLDYISRISKKNSVVTSTTYATYSDYTVFESPSSILYGNETTTEFEFDPTGKILSHIITDPNQNEILNDNYSWDQLQRPTFITDQTFNQHGGTGSLDYTQAFTYDIPGRLITASGLYGQLSYGYDVGGNLTQKGDTSYVYSNHQIKTAHDASGNEIFSASYDDKGNMTNQVVNNVSSNYGYDYANRLNYFGAGDINPTSKTPLFYYNHLGQMVYNNSNDQNAYYFDGMFETVGSQITHYVKGPYGLIASETYSGSTSKEISGTPSNGTLYFHQNYLNSTILATDESGAKNKANRLVYKPYGGVYKLNGANNFRPKFDGKELISGSGLYYFNARFYNPALGRFITADTRLAGGALQPDSRNPYAFGLNNPVTYSDPSGHSVWHWIKHHEKSINVMDLAVVEVIAGAALTTVDPQAGAALIGGGMQLGIYDASTSPNKLTMKGAMKAEAQGLIAGFVSGGVGEMFEAGAGAAEVGMDAGEEGASLSVSDGISDEAVDGTDEEPTPKKSNSTAQNFLKGAAIGGSNDATSKFVGNVLNGNKDPWDGVFWAGAVGGITGGIGGTVGGAAGGVIGGDLGKLGGKIIGGGTKAGLKHQIGSSKEPGF
ncbi:MAG: VCBS repeat-containing protein [Flavobacteriales bacterium]|nr:VCBS repeat-containing protein [Flavobacteriales bacterium]